MTYRRLQALILRLVGTVEILAFGAVIMPREWMMVGHGWLGLTDMPTGPVFDSVMRQVSFSYGLHGVALWFLAADVERYRRLVVLTAAGYLLAGPVFFVVDLQNGMPLSWMAGNSGSCLLIGLLLLACLCGERLTAKEASQRANPC
jgi:hypothetical protein